MPERRILIAKGNDTAKIIEEFAAELSEILLQNEEVGKYVMSTYTSIEDKAIFKTGYVAALVDYYVALIFGRIGKLNYKLEIDGTEVISD